MHLHVLYIWKKQPCTLLLKMIYFLPSGRKEIHGIGNGVCSDAGRKGLYAYMAGHRGSVDECVWYEPFDDRAFFYWQNGAEHTYIHNASFPT